ncbi:MAG: single-stranded-DNA-specific exonuclease RecJ [Hyphomicrobiales bacterium]|nr:MAG: single-stranded-DNA-specific exonuclease RecJ [Hyphomicrobiales bacterium]
MDIQSLKFEGINSISNNTWYYRPLNKELIKQTKKQFDLDGLLLTILANRGIEATNLKKFLDHSLRNNIPDPKVINDMEKAIKRISKAVLNEEQIGIIGDYDVDGIVSASILYNYLKPYCRVIVKIPDRFTDGYGPNERFIEEFKQNNINLVITVDCGSNSADLISKASNIDFIIFDHHQTDHLGDIGFANVNPNRNDDKSGLSYLAAASIVFLAIISLNRELKNQSFFEGGQPDRDLLQFVPLVALATIADVVPLCKLNRAFVKQGLKLYERYNNNGIDSILRQNNSKSNITPQDIGYVISPMINAGGRMGNSNLGFELLTSDRIEVTDKIAAELKSLNESRKSKEQYCLDLAIEKYECNHKNESIITLELDALHIGVIGLIASRFKDRYQKTSCIMTSLSGEDQILIGSARSSGDVNIGELIEGALSNRILISGGGHKMAAGFKLHRKNLNLFRNFLTKADLALDTNDKKMIKADGILMASAVTNELVEKIIDLGPFGNSFEEPLFIFPGHRIQELTALNNQHLKLKICDSDGFRINAISFRTFDLPLGQLLRENQNKRLHFLGRLAMNFWNNKATPQLIIDDAAIT